MNKTYIKPVTDIVVINLKGSVMTEGDAAASGGANGGDGWANQIEFDRESDSRSSSDNEPSLWK